MRPELFASRAWATVTMPDVALRRTSNFVAVCTCEAESCLLNSSYWPTVLDRRSAPETTEVVPVPIDCVQADVLPEANESLNRDSGNDVAMSAWPGAAVSPSAPSAMPTISSARAARRRAAEVLRAAVSRTVCCGARDRASAGGISLAYIRSFWGRTGPFDYPQQFRIARDPG